MRLPKRARKCCSRIRQRTRPYYFCGKCHKFEEFESAIELKYKNFLLFSDIFFTLIRVDIMINSPFRKIFEFVDFSAIDGKSEF